MVSVRKLCHGLSDASQNFEDAIRIAVLADGDTDTKADITGAIAEAFYEIPDTMIEETFSYLPKEMLNVIDLFYEKFSTDNK